MWRQLDPLSPVPREGWGMRRGLRAVQCERREPMGGAPFEATLVTEASVHIFQYARGDSWLLPKAQQWIVKARYRVNLRIPMETFVASARRWR